MMMMPLEDIICLRKIGQGTSTKEDNDEEKIAYALPISLFQSGGNQDIIQTIPIYIGNNLHAGAKLDLGTFSDKYIVCLG